MSRRLLIVDDEKNIRLTLTRTLQPEGYEILTAVNGEEAVHLIRECKDIDVVLLDMKMPGMDGLEVLRKIHHIPGAPVVIMMTAYGTVGSAVEAMKLGAVDYISKPFSPRQVRDIVEAVGGRTQLTPPDAVDYQSSIQLAKRYITDRDFHAAKDMLKKAIAYDYQKPEAFNLMGVLLEMTGKLRDAQKQYRAALALDPTYSAASDNLERTTKFQYKQEGINLGEDNDAESEGEH